MIKDVLNEKNLHFENLSSHKPGTYLNVLCQDSYFVNIPPYADFIFGAALSVSFEDEEDDSQMQNKLSTLEKLVKSKSSLNLSLLLSEDQVFKVIWDIIADEIQNSFTMTKDDLVLSVSTLTGSPTTLIVSIVEEQYLKRRNVASVGNSTIQSFGRILNIRSVKRDHGTYDVLFIEPLSITL